MVSSSARNAIRAQAVGAAILAAVAGLAVVAAVGQLLLRQRAAGATERRPLLALGYTRRQAATEGIVWASAVIAAGVLLGVVGAILLTPLVPQGFLRRLDPAAGEISFDPVVLLGGAAVLGLALLAWVAVGSLAARPAVDERPSTTTETLTRSLQPAEATGVRFAFARGRSGRSALVTTAALAVAIAVALGSAVFASNIHTLVSDPARYGSDFDYITGNSFGTGEPAPWPDVEQLDGLAGASFVATSSAVLDGAGHRRRGSRSGPRQPAPPGPRGCLPGQRGRGGPGKGHRPRARPPGGRRGDPDERRGRDGDVPGRGAGRPAEPVVRSGWRPRGGHAPVRVPAAGAGHRAEQPDDRPGARAPPSPPSSSRSHRSGPSSRRRRRTSSTSIAPARSRPCSRYWSARSRSSRSGTPC